MGCKKVQQQLSQPGELERFVTPEEAERLRAVLARLSTLTLTIDLDPDPNTHPNPHPHPNP